MPMAAPTSVNVARLTYLLVCELAGVAIALSTKGSAFEVPIWVGVIGGLGGALAVWLKPEGLLFDGVMYSGLLLVVAAAGYLLERPSDFSALAPVMVGTLLVAAAGCALNHSWYASSMPSWPWSSMLVTPTRCETTSPAG